MKRQHFEDWLLNDKKLNEAEQRELDSHLRTCSSCAALAETGFALRAARMISPAPGFTSRFKIRLAAQKIAERRRKFWGAFLLILTGAILFAWLAAPYVYAFLLSPAEWITAAIGYFLFTVTSLQIFAEMISVFLKVIPDILPPYAWMVIASALAGFSLLWTISIWRFSRAPQGASL
ncbi:MAG: hypothetical protein PHQ36_04580 [Anaerolineales bacterium]|nr:hypothetical protein [Anaerolineales bacterium]